MYARLRGIENSQIPGVVENLIDTLMLRKHAKKQAGVYRYAYGSFDFYKSAIIFVSYRTSLSLHCLGRDARKPVFGVSDQVRHKPTCTSTEKR